MEADLLSRAARLSPVSWSQRLGYLLERVVESDMAETLAPLVGELARSYTPLRRAAPSSGAARDASWKLIVNVEIEPDE